MALVGAIIDHPFRQDGHASVGYCGHLDANLSPCGAHRDCHAYPLVSLPSGPPVRADYERALERIRELEDREKANAGHFQTVWDQLTEQKLLRDANEGRIQELEAELASAKQLGALAEAERVRMVANAQEPGAHITALKSQRQVLMDSERELNAQLAHMTASRNHEAGANIELRAENASLAARLSNLDALAREVSARVEKMLGALGPLHE